LDTIVSVVICVRDVQSYIENCIRSLLKQTFKDFEIVFIDDGSVDKTSKIINGYNDVRIRYYRNKVNLGISRSRNIGLSHVRGKYVFFTDGDCVVTEDWIEQGIKYFKDTTVFGVEGRIDYVSENYKPSFSDHVTENKHACQFMTGSMAYRMSAITIVGGFDERLGYYEDRDLGLRIQILKKSQKNSKQNCAFQKIQ